MSSSLRRACAAGIMLLAASPVAATAEDEAPGKAIFLEGVGDLPPCAICHTLADAGASGTIGPDLDQLRPDAAKISAAVRDGVGVMPPYGEVLTSEQIEAVADYVATAAAD